MAIDRFPIEEGHVLLFARAIGDLNPAYTDRERDGGILAPPTFVQASAQFQEGYPLRPQPGKPWFGSGKNPTGLTAGSGGGGGGGGGGGLHAEQRYEYHRPVRVGDVLHGETKAGSSWEKQGRRGGTLVFQELITEYRDEAGELVVTATGLSVRTEKVPTQ